jgi:hypothetical protein
MIIQLPVVCLQYSDDTRLVVFNDKPVNMGYGKGPFLRNGKYFQVVDSFDRPWISASDCEDRDMGMMDVKRALHKYKGADVHLMKIIDEIKKYKGFATSIAGYPGPDTWAHFVYILIPFADIKSAVVGGSMFNVRSENMLVIDSIQPSLTRLNDELSPTLLRGVSVEHTLGRPGANGWPTALCESMWIITEKALRKWAIIRMFADINESTRSNETHFHTITPYKDRKQEIGFTTWINDGVFPFYAQYPTADDLNMMHIHLQFRIPPTMFTEVPSCKVVTEIGKCTGLCYITVIAHELSKDKDRIIETVNGVIETCAYKRTMEIKFDSNTNPSYSASIIQTQWQ